MAPRRPGCLGPVAADIQTGDGAALCEERGSQSDGGGREGCSLEAQAAEREKMAARLAETPESALKAPGGDHGQT